MLRQMLSVGFVLACAVVGDAQHNQKTWQQQRAIRQAALDKHLKQNAIALRWFADFPFGTDDGIPYLILRSLPLLAPEEWGEGNDFLSAIGLFRDERQLDYPLARGIGWSGLGRAPDDDRPDFAAFACGACHVGRVRGAEGKTIYLNGGINSEFNIVAYRTKVKNTIDAVVADTPLDQRVSKVTSVVLKTVDQAHRKNPNFYYGDYQFGQKFDAAYEAKQIQLFQANAETLVANFLVRMELELSSLKELVDKNYRGFEQPMLGGFGGMADATGVSSSFGFVVARSKDPNVTADSRLPPTPGLTDFMAVWEQGKRKVRWNDDQTDLIDGGGQWNGNIPLPIYRNLAAEMTMGFGASTDVRIAEFGQQLLKDLPAPPYPFAVDLDLATTGEQLFADNCRDCHRAGNGRVYKNMGTDLNRAFVVSESMAAGARVGFSKVGAFDREVSLPPAGHKVMPFSAYDGVPLQNKQHLIMRNPADCQGYNALPLGGIWAQGPYLHTGSVPTLYHLLMPKARPDVFTKSRLEYDQDKVGFQWTPPTEPNQSQGYRFDTRAFPAITNRGHDRNIFDQGKVYKLDWSDDKQGALAIIEFMKTL